MFEIKDDFLDKDHLQKIKDTILDLDFPWRIRQGTTPNKKDSYFTYCFYNYYSPQSEHFNSLIIPILEKLNVKALIQARTNMFLSDLFTKSGFHIDYPFKCKTSILYLNSCNGGTDFKIKGKTKFLEAKENRLVTFSDVEHRAVTSTDSSVRYIINLNYF